MNEITYFTQSPATVSNYSSNNLFLQYLSGTFTLFQYLKYYVILLSEQNTQCDRYKEETQHNHHFMSNRDILPPKPHCTSLFLALLP